MERLVNTRTERPQKQRETKQWSNCKSNWKLQYKNLTERKRKPEIELEYWKSFSRQINFCKSSSQLCKTVKYLLTNGLPQSNFHTIYDAANLQ